MSRRLAAAVHVQHPSTREWIVLEAGGAPDDELAVEITNPDAWVDDGPSADPEGPELEKGEPKSFGFAAPPEPEAESTPPAPRRRRKTPDADA